MNDQPGAIQVLPAQVVEVAAAGTEIVELAGPVDTVDRAQPGAPASQLRLHGDPDLRTDGVADRQRLKSSVQVAGHDKSATGGVRGGENPAGQPERSQAVTASDHAR